VKSLAPSDRLFTLNTQHLNRVTNLRYTHLKQSKGQDRGNSDDDPYSRILRPLYLSSKEDRKRTPETYPLEGESEDIEARLSYLGL